MTKKINLDQKPLHEMTLEELERERSFRERIRFAFDGDNRETHLTLKRRLDEVVEHIKAREEGILLPFESEQD